MLVQHIKASKRMKAAVAPRPTLLRQTSVRPRRRGNARFIVLFPVFLPFASSVLRSSADVFPVFSRWLTSKEAFSS